MNSYFSWVDSGRESLRFGWWNGAGYSLVSVPESFDPSLLDGSDEIEILIALGAAGSVEFGAFEYANGGRVTPYVAEACLLRDDGSLTPATIFDTAEEMKDR